MLLPGNADCGCETAVRIDTVMHGRYDDWPGTTEAIYFRS